MSVDEIVRSLEFAVKYGAYQNHTARVAMVPAALIDVSNPNKIGTYPATRIPEQRILRKIKRSDKLDRESSGLEQRGGRRADKH